MDQGEYICETGGQQASLRIFALCFILFGFFPFFASGGILDSTGKEFWEQILFVMSFSGMGLLFFIIAKPPKHKYRVFELGIAHDEKGKETTYHSYEEVRLVECFYRRVKRNKRGDSYYYYLVFWFQDASYATIKVKSSSALLKENWKQLVLSNPNLIDRLVCTVNDPTSKKLYEELNQLNL